MSSFPQHVENIEALKKLGFDVSEAYKNGAVSLDSWCYDDLTYLISDIVKELEIRKFNSSSN